MTEKRIDKYLFNTKDQIGDGSYAVVYLGKNEKTGEKVAIKMLSKSVINAYIITLAKRRLFARRPRSGNQDHAKVEEPQHRSASRRHGNQQQLLHHPRVL